MEEGIKRGKGSEVGVGGRGKEGTVGNVMYVRGSGCGVECTG